MKHDLMNLICFILTSSALEIQSPKIHGHHFLQGLYPEQNPMPCTHEVFIVGFIFSVYRGHCGVLCQVDTCEVYWSFDIGPEPGGIPVLKLEKENGPDQIIPPFLLLNFGIASHLRA